METVVLTGATGFIGAALVKLLLKNRYNVIVLLREDSDISRIKELNGLNTERYTILNDERLAIALKKYSPDTFIHLAWKGVHGRNRNDIYQITENIPFTIQSVELANSIGCTQWVGIGSQAEYGNPNTKVSENFPTNPTTLYGKAKLAACWSSLGMCEAFNITGSWIRVFSTYGIGDEPTWFIPYIIGQLKQKQIPDLTACEQLWDYLYVDDAAEAILSVARARVNGIFNIGTGNAVSLRHIVELIRNKIDSNLKINYGAVPYRPDQVMHLEADVNKIYHATGWKYAVSLEEGIDQIINQYK